MGRRVAWVVALQGLITACGASRAPLHTDPAPPPTDTAPPTPPPAQPTAAASTSTQEASPTLTSNAASEAESCHGSTLTPLVPVDSAAPDADPALVAKLSTKQREELKLLARVCETAVTEASDGGVQAGCACCPPFDQCPPTKRGTPIASTMAFSLTTQNQGAFSGPGQRELSLGFDGCEPHADNYGGTALYRETQDGIALVHYATAIHPKQCRVLRLATGRDVQLCEFFDAHMGHAHSQVYIYDFGAEPNQCFHPLVWLDDSTESGCWSDVGADIVVSTLESVSTPDLNRDGMPDIRVHAKHGTGKVTERLRTLCGEWELARERWEKSARKHRGPEPKPGYFQEFPASKPLELDFIATGTTYAPTPETVERLKRIAPPQ